MRQVEPISGTFEAYAAKLMEFPADDVYEACERIGSQPRAAGEKAFPEVGLIREECERLGMRRQTPQTEGWAIYACSKCNITQAGKPAPCIKCGGWTDKIADAVNKEIYRKDVDRNRDAYFHVAEVWGQSLERHWERRAIQEGN